MIEKNESYTSFAVGKDKLSKALACVGGSVEKHSNVPSLSQVRFSLSDKGMIISATDMEIFSSHLVDANPRVECCEFAVSASTLHDIVRKLEGSLLIDFDFFFDTQRLAIKSGHCSFLLPCTNVNNFPIIDDSDLVRYVDFSGVDISCLFEKTKFAISTETGRYNLSGCYLKLANGKIEVVATDCHRLAYYSVAFPNSSPEDDFDCIIPKKTINELTRMVREKDVTVLLPKSGKISRIKFIFGNTQVISKVIAADFPDHDRVIPESYEFEIKLNRCELMRAVERVSVIFVDRIRSVRLQFSKEGTLVLHASNPDSSRATEVIDIFEGGIDIEVGFNYSYLLDILASIDSEKVIFYLNDNQLAVRVSSENDLNTWFYIIMPMSI